VTLVDGVDDAVDDALAVTDAVVDGEVEDDGDGDGVADGGAAGTKLKPRQIMYGALQAVRKRVHARKQVESVNEAQHDQSTSSAVGLTYRRLAKTSLPYRSDGAHQGRRQAVLAMRSPPRWRCPETQVGCRHTRSGCQWWR